jgi:hypothetical protein
MPDKKITTSLNEFLVSLSQSINVDYLSLVNRDGEERASAGNPGDLNQADVNQLLQTHFNQPENFAMPGEIGEIRIIKQGMVECFVAPIDGSVQLLALASLERPSVLIRTMMNELLKARGQITEIVSKEWKETQIKTTPEPKNAPVIKEKAATTGDSLEDLIANTPGEVKGKNASKFWDNATLEEQGPAQNGQTISFDEARRSGLVPDDKK